MAEEKKSKKIKIIIPSTPENNGDVFVSLNEKTYLIKRDVEVEVTDDILTVLDDAVINTVRPDSKGKLKPISIKRFAYQVVK